MSDLSTNQEYLASLERIIKEKTEILPKGAKLSLKNIALEAGRKKDSVRREKSEQKEVIDAYDDAKEKMEKPIKAAKAKASKWKDTYDELEEKYNALLARELMLLKGYRELEVENKKLKEKLGKKLQYANVIQ